METSRTQRSDAGGPCRPDAGRCPRIGTPPVRSRFATRAPVDAGADALAPADGARLAPTRRAVAAEAPIPVSRQCSGRLCGLRTPARRRRRLAPAHGQPRGARGAVGRAGARRTRPARAPRSRAGRSPRRPAYASPRRRAAPAASRRPSSEDDLVLDDLLIARARASAPPTCT